MKIVPQSCRNPLAIISIAASIALVALPAHAFERVAESVSFTINCFGLMISDPPEHVTVCNPVFQNNPYESSMHSAGDPAPVPVVVAVAPPPPAPPPPVPGPAPGPAPVKGFQ